MNEKMSSNIKNYVEHLVAFINKLPDYSSSEAIIYAYKDFERNHFIDDSTHHLLTSLQAHVFALINIFENIAPLSSISTYKDCIKELLQKAQQSIFLSCDAIEKQDEYLLNQNLKPFIDSYRILEAFELSQIIVQKNEELEFSLNNSKPNLYNFCVTITLLAQFQEIIPQDKKYFLSFYLSGWINYQKENIHDQNCLNILRDISKQLSYLLNPFLNLEHTISAKQTFDHLTDDLKKIISTVETNTILLNFEIDWLQNIKEEIIECIKTANYSSLFSKNSSPLALLKVLKRSKNPLLFFTKAYDNLIFFVENLRDFGSKIKDKEQVARSFGEMIDYFIELLQTISDSEPTTQTDKNIVKSRFNDLSQIFRDFFSLIKF